MPLLKLHLVRTFMVIVEPGSFSAAAATLGLSQPTVSQHVRRLKRLTGERLFQRDTHPVTLSTNGAVLERFAREMVALDDQAQAYYAGTTEQARIRLGVSEDLALTHLPSPNTGDGSDRPTIDPPSRRGVPGSIRWSSGSRSSHWCLSAPATCNPNRPYSRYDSQTCAAPKSSWARSRVAGARCITAPIRGH